MQLLDLSSNGTYVNGKAVGKSKLHTLSSGDEIALLNPSAKAQRCRDPAETLPRRLGDAWEDVRETSGKRLGECGRRLGDVPGSLG